MRTRIAVLWVTFSAVALAAGHSASQTGARAAPFESAAAFGEALFFDVNLSKNRSQACATCHDPARAFTDPRETAAGRAVSVGDDGVSLGDRNAPSAAYAMFSPSFQKREDGTYIGGQFHDGRASDLAAQAGGPPLNPVEMGLYGIPEAASRILENPRYAATLEAHYPEGILDDSDAIYAAATEAIAAFERTDLFAPFDSKYDRYLHGEATLTEAEELGRVLFFSQQFTNCSQCHRLRTSPVAKDETFTDYSYRNIGVPANLQARSANGVTALDQGLLQNPAVDDPAQAGKFKVPSLRNVAVTGPYMHNGVFRDLRTVVLFYDKYNSKAAKRMINPETGSPWREPEVDGTVALDELTDGPALDDGRVDALVAFLGTLTDRRYEPLLAE